MAIPNRIAVLNDDGTTDTSFAPTYGLNATGRCLQVASNGSVVVGGDFTQADVYERNHMAQFEADGAVSPNTANTNNSVRTIIGQTDGKFLIGGLFTSVGSNSRSRMARLNDSLIVEEAYAPSFDGPVYALAQQEDGKTLAGGAFANVSSTARANIVRLYNNDATTNLTVQTVSLIQWLRGGASQEVQRVSFEEPAGTAIAGTITRITGGWQFVPTTPLTGSGTITARAYGTDSHSEGIFEDTVAYNVDPEIQVTIDGQIMVDGVSSVDYGDVQSGTTVSKTVTITNIGLDNLTLTNGPNYVELSGTNANQWSIPAQPSTPITPGSSVNFSLLFSPTSTGSKTATLTIHSNDADENPFTISLLGDAIPGPGGIDTTWEPVLNGSVFSPAISRTDEIWLGGVFTSINSLGRNRYARLNLSGVVQSQTGTGANNTIYALCQLPDGKVLIGGDFTSINGITRNRLARLNADGSLDTSFNLSVVGNPVTSFALEATGNVLIGGAGFTTVGGVTVNSGFVRILMSSGTVDTSFTPALNNVIGASVQTDGKIVVWRSVTNPPIIRLNSNGSLDSSFSPVIAPSSAAIYTAVIQQDNKIVCSGSFTTINGGAHTGTVRLTDAGSYDNTFTNVVTSARSLQIQCDAKIVIGSDASGGIASTERLVRVQSTGVNDSAFVATARNTVSGLVLQEDGKVIATGQFTLSGSSTKYAARLINDINGATSALSVVSPTQVQWIRTGTAPNVQIVMFAYSQDGGTTWTDLGQGTRLSNGWQLTGISLPISGILRGQAFVQCGYANGSVTIHEDQVSFSDLAVGDLSVEYPVGTIISDNGSLDFPSTLPGQNLDYTLTLRNTGLADLTGIVASVPAGSWSIISSPISTLAPNQTTTLVLRFSPTVIGYVPNVFLSIASSVAGAKNPYLIRLSGSGAAVPTATTTNSTSPGSGQRTLNGTFRANYDAAGTLPASASAYFQYKLASATTWIDTSPATSISGFSNVGASKTITGLTAGQSYNWRAIVYNPVNAGQAPGAPFTGSIGTFTAT